VTVSRTHDALVEQGALLFARHGVDGVTARQLHEAVAARNESALHYHFGGKEGLVAAILTAHLAAIEERRARLVVAIAAEDRSGDLRALVHALAAPMAEDLGSELGRAHLRIVAQVSHPSLAYQPPFQVVDAPAGRAVVRWLGDALAWLPDIVRRERMAALREQLLSLFGLRAQLLDQPPEHLRLASNELFVQGLVDVLVAGLAATPSAETLAALSDDEDRGAPAPGSGPPDGAATNG
jgi:AcrR family transcriptional regulator